MLTKLDLHVKQRQAVDMPAAEDLLEGLSRIRLPVLPTLKFHALPAKRYLLQDAVSCATKSKLRHDIPPW